MIFSTQEKKKHSIPRVIELIMSYLKFKAINVLSVAGICVTRFDNDSLGISDYYTNKQNKKTQYPTPRIAVVKPTFIYFFQGDTNLPQKKKKKSSISKYNKSTAFSRVIYAYKKPVVLLFGAVD